MISHVGVVDVWACLCQKKKIFLKPCAEFVRGVFKPYSTTSTVSLRTPHISNKHATITVQVSYIIDYHGAQPASNKVIWPSSPRQNPHNRQWSLHNQSWLLLPHLHLRMQSNTQLHGARPLQERLRRLPTLQMQRLWRNHIPAPSRERVLGELGSREGDLGA